LKKAVRHLVTGCAVLSALLASISIPLSLAVRHLIEGALELKTYENALVAGGVYDAIPHYVAEALPKLAGATIPGVPPEVLARILNTDQEPRIRRILPPDLVRALVNATLEQGLRFVLGQDERVELPAREVKANLTGQAEVDSVYALLDLEHAPECGFADLERMVIQGNLVLCRPPGKYVLQLAGVTTTIEFRPYLEQKIREALSALPDAFILASAEEPAFTALRATVPRIQRYARLGPAVPAILLAIALALGVRSWTAFFRWLGVTVLAGGVLGLLLLIETPSLDDYLIRSFVLPRLPALLPSDAIAAVRGVMLSVLRQRIEPLRLESEVLAGVGGLMALLPSLFGAQQQPTP
jgi:hypothetical protein